MGKGGAMREYAEEPRGSTSRNGEKCWGLRVGGKGGHAEAGARGGPAVMSARRRSAAAGTSKHPEPHPALHGREPWRARASPARREPSSPRARGLQTHSAPVE